jgi:cell wall-associated NlpC family hydrolase
VGTIFIDRSSCKLAVIGMFVAAALGTTLSGSASAHHLSNVSKQRDHIENRARAVTGSPYRSGGTSPQGFDCSGFTRWTFLNHGANLPHSSIKQYELASKPGHKRINKRTKLRVGDLVFHKTTSAKVGHAGIYIGDGKFISSTSSSGVRVKSLWDPYYWGPRWVGATRLPATTAR